MPVPDSIMTSRCRLRLPRTTDLDDLMVYANDPDWARYLPVPQPYLREQGEEWLRMQIEGDRGRHPVWAIEAEGAFAGMTNLIIDLEVGEAELGISLKPSSWGRGLAREVLAALMATTFEHLDTVTVLRAWADRRNERSRRLLDRLGFRFDGIVEGRREVRGESIDDAGYHLDRP